MDWRGYYGCANMNINVLIVWYNIPLTKGKGIADPKMKTIYPHVIPNPLDFCSLLLWFIFNAWKIRLNGHSMHGQKFRESKTNESLTFVCWVIFHFWVNSPIHFCLWNVNLSPKTIKHHTLEGLKAIPFMNMLCLQQFKTQSCYMYRDVWRWCLPSCRWRRWVCGVEVAQRSSAVAVVAAWSRAG